MLLAESADDDGGADMEGGEDEERGRPRGDTGAVGAKAYAKERRLMEMSVRIKRRRDIIGADADARRRRRCLVSFFSFGV